MIEKMKKITLLVSEQEKDIFLSKLRKEGVLHIHHIEPPTANAISFSEDKIARLEELIQQLEPYVGAERPDRRSLGSERDVLNCMEPVAESCREKTEIEAEIEELKKKIEWYEDWGEFNPEDIKQAEEKGAYIRLYIVKKKDLKKIKLASQHHILKKEKGNIYLALITTDEKENLPFDEISIPEDGPDALCAKIDDLCRKKAAIEESLKQRARNIGPIRKCKEKFEKDLEALKVRFGMGGEKKFSYLQGFCPVKKLDNIKDLAKRYDLGYIAEDPDSPAETPTLITNPKWINMISPVFKFMNTVPGYDEFDISAVFLVFFSLFFAMLIGDAGYGCIFLTITFLARRKFRKAPKEPFFLMYLLGGATLIWGAITGTWFGSETIANLPFFSGMIVQKINSFAGDNQNFIIYICFVIGAVQLTIAHLMKAIKFINSPRAIGDIGWMGIVWGMFFAAGKLVIGRPFPHYAGLMLLGGAVLVLVFANFQKNIFKGMMETIVDLPLSIIGAFSDVVSYLRLFAVGYASVVLASTFNGMALEGGINSVLGGLAAALILFLGHTLNIILGMMAVVVHGIRLNMLEFSGHLGMQWSGQNYAPFRE